MTAIIIPRRHYTQPQGRVEIAPEWEDGLIGVFLPPAMSREWQITGTTGLLVPRRDGIAFDTNGGGTYASKPVVAHQNTGFTMLVSGVTKNKSGQDYAGVYNGGTYQGLLYSLGLAKFSYYPRNGLGVTFDAAPALAAYGGDEYTLIGGGDGISHAGALMQNGALYQLSGAYSGASAYDRVHSGGRFAAGGSVSNTLSAFWRKFLVPDAQRELALNPWQLFRADPIRIYSLPTGAISINSIAASNITQTGARITLGLTR